MTKKYSFFSVFLEIKLKLRFPFRNFYQKVRFVFRNFGMNY